jgi:hypothetical protein
MAALLALVFVYRHTLVSIKGLLFPVPISRFRELQGALPGRHADHVTGAELALEDALR